MSRPTPAQPFKAPPPDPSAYRTASPQERISRLPIPPSEPPPEETKLLNRLWPSTSVGEKTAQTPAAAKNPARGIEAAQQFVRQGVLDHRYRPAARRLTALMCALPVAIYLSYELFERRFHGREQKKRLALPAGSVKREEGPSGFTAADHT